MNKRDRRDQAVLKAMRWLEDNSIDPKTTVNEVQMIAEVKMSYAEARAAMMRIGAAAGADGKWRLAGIDIDRVHRVRV